MFVDIIKVYIL